MPHFTTPDATLRWMFIDMNSYFASVEQQDRPALRGRPVAVVPMQTDATCAIAASYEAKAFGIKTGTLIHEARRKCPDLVCVLARHDLYVDYHHRILAEIDNHTPITKVWSVDELSSQLQRQHQQDEAAIALAHRIKDGLRKNVGEYIRCSIGLAPNSYLAKVATDMQKPDGLVVLKGDGLPGRLLDLRLTDLPGINTAMERRLNAKGIRTLEQLWRTAPKQARALWGSVEGERFWYNLHGYQVPDRVTHKSMIGHSRVLDPELRPIHAAWTVAERLTLKSASRLRRIGFEATHFGLSVRVPNGPRWARDIKIPACHDNITLLRTVQDLWARMISDTHPTHLKKISVTLHGLCQAGDVTGDLFTQASPIQQKQTAKYEKISAVLDALNQRYGHEAIRMGISPKTRAGYLGTKIAFNRVPDMKEFRE